MFLLKIEWLKIKKYTTFWLLVGLFTGLFFLATYVISKGMWSLEGLFNSSFAFPSIWSNLGNLYSWFILFLCVFVILSITNEFAFKTHRQNIIDGQSRLDFLHAKLLLILAITFTATIFYILIALVFGLINGGGNIFEGMESVLYVFLFTLNYLCFSALIAFYIKRSGLAIILLLSYFVFESILGLIIKYNFKSRLGNFFPLQSSDELLPWNALKTMGKLVGKGEVDIDNYYYLIATCIWIVVYYFILRRKMATSDL